MKKIIIVGGGTAGWLTALYAKKKCSRDDIILVESEEFGILGAGEGTTPNFLDFLNYLEIPVSDIITHCKATIKNGIKFTNWSQNQKFYYHPFVSNSTSSAELNFTKKNNYAEPYTAFSHFVEHK